MFGNDLFTYLVLTLTITALIIFAQAVKYMLSISLHREQLRMNMAASTQQLEALFGEDDDEDQYEPGHHDRLP